MEKCVQQFMLFNKHPTTENVMFMEGGLCIRAL